MPRPVNPYIAGPPVFGNSGFFNREHILTWVDDQIRNPNTSSLVLFGQRRIGKTSLLLQLDRLLPRGLFQPVYFDLHFRAKKALGEVLADLAETMAPLFFLDVPEHKRFDNRGRFFRQDFLASVIRVLDRERRIIFLLDEYDVLDPLDEEGLTEFSAARTLVPFLFRLMHEERRLGFVFVVGRRADDLDIDLKAAFKSSLAKEVGVLDRKSAELLVRQGTEANALNFSNEGVERIFELTGCHPFLTQLLCQCIWDQVQAGNRAQPVEKAEVEKAVDEALARGDYALTWLWDGLTANEKIFASGLAQIGDEGRAVFDDAVLSTIDEKAPGRRTREVEQAARVLVKRKVFEEPSPGYHLFSVDLLRRWVKARRGLEPVSYELDEQLKPRAEAEVVEGERLFRKQEWAKACVSFKAALEINPGHFRAKFLLGETLLASGRPEKAVKELEDAYRISANDTRTALIRALIEHAKEIVRIDDDGALKKCERVLDISPNHAKARKMANWIWSRRGDQATRNGNFEDALKCYRRGSNQIKITELEKRVGQQKKLVMALAQAVREASDACTLAAGSEFDGRGRGCWYAAVGMLMREAAAARTLGEGIAALLREDWEWAERRLRRVERINPRVESPSLAGGRDQGSRISTQARTEHDKNVANAIRQLRQLDRYLQGLQRVCEKVGGRATSEAAKAATKLALRRIHEKERAYSNYVRAATRLQQGKVEQSERITGWLARLPSRDGPGKAVSH